MKSELDCINTYYTGVEKPIINEFCKNNYIKNLLKLSIENDLYVISRKHKQWAIKDHHDLLSECRKRKKKEIKKTTSLLAILANSCNKNSLTEIKKINTELETKLTNIDTMIDLISSNTEDEYIECYSNK